MTVISTTHILVNNARSKSEEVHKKQPLNNSLLKKDTIAAIGVVLICTIGILTLIWAISVDIILMIALIDKKDSSDVAVL